MNVGIELCPPPGGPRPVVAEWLEAASVAEEAGLDTVWLSAGVGDPSTLAGALSVVTTSIGLGVVATVGPDGRNPSVLAREVTALDRLSSGRAAMCLVGEGQRVAEAAAVVGLLFTGDEVDFDGSFFHLTAAVNRPGPLGRPPVLIQSSAPWPGTTADGWVVTGGAEGVASWRAELEAPIFWRGPLGMDPAARVASLLDAGVDGLIVQVGASPDAVAAVVRELH